MAETPPADDVRGPPGVYLHLIRTIDRAMEYIGYLVALLMAPLILANTIEVFMRYVFNRPTVWAMDITVMSYGTLLAPLQESLGWPYWVSGGGWRGGGGGRCRRSSGGTSPAR